MTTSLLTARTTSTGHPWQAMGARDRRQHAQARIAEPLERQARTSPGRPVRPELVCEVGYDHLQGDRFRHATSFRRWRPDRQPASCTYAQLEAAVPEELARVFGAGA